MPRRESRIPKKGPSVGPPKDYGQTRMGGALRSFPRQFDSAARKERDGDDEKPWMVNLRTTQELEFDYLRAKGPVHDPLDMRNALAHSVDHLVDVWAPKVSPQLCEQPMTPGVHPTRSQRQQLRAAFSQTQPLPGRSTFPSPAVGGRQHLPRGPNTPSPPRRLPQQGRRRGARSKSSQAVDMRQFQILPLTDTVYNNIKDIYPQAERQWKLPTEHAVTLAVRSRLLGPKLRNTLSGLPEWCQELEPFPWKEDTPVKVVIPEGKKYRVEKPKAGWTEACYAAAAGDCVALQNIAMRSLQRGESGTLDAETMYGDTPLLIAAQEGKIEALMTLLQLKANPCHENRYGETALTRAALEGALPSVRSLVASKVDLDHQSGHGDTALTRVSGQGKIETALELVALGAGINQETRKGLTALHAAAANDHCELARMLVQQGADVNQETTVTGQSPIMTASANNKVNMLRTLHSLGGQLDFESKAGDTALSFAAKRGILSAISDLVESGANVEHDTSDGYSPLGHSATQSQLAACGLLIRLGAKVNREMGNGCIPLGIVAQAGDLELVEFLVDEGAIVDMESTCHESALCLAARHDHAPCIKLLYKLKANPNMAMHDLKTPLMYAASHGAVNGLSALVQVGADVSIEVPPGATALTLAATNGKAAAVQSLVSLRAEVDQETQLEYTYHFPMGRDKVEVRGSTALICSIASFQDHVCKLLLGSLKAQPEFEDKYGRTVLMSAVTAENLSTMTDLVNSGADPNRMTDQDITPLIHAALLNKPKATRALRQLGADTYLESQCYGTPAMAAADKGNVEALEALFDGEVAGMGIDQESRRGMTALTHACKANSVPAIKRLVELKASVDKGTRYDEAPLDICLLYKSMDAMEVLLNARANPDRLSKYGITPTEVSMSMGDRDIIKLLVTAYRPSERDKATMARLAAKPFSAKELAMKEMLEYAEEFYEEHDRMWGVNSGYESLI